MRKSDQTQLRVTLIMLALVAVAAAAIWSGVATTLEAGVVLFALYAVYLLYRRIRRHL